MGSSQFFITGMGRLAVLACVLVSGPLASYSTPVGVSHHALNHGVQRTPTAVGTSGPLLEAEKMTLPTASGRPYTDSSAYNQAALLVWNNATASGLMSAPGGGHLRVTARADLCVGPAHMSVYVDGAPVLSTTVASSTWQTFGVNAPWPEGTHRVQVGFTNDYVSPSCDRNLRVDRLVIRPRSVHRMFGLSSDGPDQGISTAEATSSALSHSLDIVNFYQAWEWRSPLPVAELGKIAAAGARPEITWEPWDPRQGVVQPAYALTQISGGAYDDYINSWARAAASYGKPLLLRFAHEMNSSWYPWAAAVNGGSGSAYIAAYQHVHNLFRAAGARNVVWVWSPNVVDGMPTSLASVYPGDGYVDLIGVDGYNGGADVGYMGGWRSPQQVFGTTLGGVKQLAPTVPVIVNETGSSEQGGSKGEWITQLISLLKSDSQVAGLLWFDFFSAGATDWRLASSPSSLAAAKAALAAW